MNGFFLTTAGVHELFFSAPAVSLPLQSDRFLPCFHLVLLATIRINTRIVDGG